MDKDTIKIIVQVISILVTVWKVLYERHQKAKDKKEQRMKEIAEKHKEGEGLPPRKHTHR